MVLSVHMAVRAVHPGLYIGAIRPADKLFSFPQPCCLPADLPQFPTKPWGPKNSVFVAGRIRLRGDQFVGSLARPLAAAKSFEGALARHGLAVPTAPIAYQTVEQALNALRNSCAAGVLLCS